MFLYILTMEISTIDARQELKRVDHLIFVTLKYTRTVDVLRSILKRLISAYDNLMIEMLTVFKDQEMIMAIPIVPGLRTKAIENTLPNDTLNEMINFYRHLRKLLNVPFKKNQEYRRHVNMEVEFDEGVFKVFIDTVEDYYHKTLNYFENVEKNFQFWMTGEYPEEE